MESILVKPHNHNGVLVPNVALSSKGVLCSEIDLPRHGLKVT
jgi:hypothetical protein